MKINFLFILAAVLLLWSCQTLPPVKEGTFQKAQWETKAQIKDLKKNKNHNLSIDIVSFKNERLRMDVTATLGYSVATFVMTREGFKCLLIPQKKFVEGGLSDGSLNQTLHLPFPPKALYSIAFDEPILGNGWDCGGNATPNLCFNKDSQVKIEWTRKPEGTRMIKIQSPQMEMSWFFNNPKTEFQEKPDLFKITVPDGYQKVAI